MEPSGSCASSVLTSSYLVLNTLHLACLIEVTIHAKNTQAIIFLMFCHNGFEVLDTIEILKND